MNLKYDYSIRKTEIASRLREFKQITEKDSFYELCFCLLTPQSSAKRADMCIRELKKKNFKEKNFDPTLILKKRIRFHNNKGRYLIQLKANYSSLKKSLDKISDNKEKRGFLEKNVKGIGLKEASHYLRNTGHENLAILDRHILKNLKKFNVIEEIPKLLTKKNYFEIESKFENFSKDVKIPMDHLDLLFWAAETGEIFK